MQTEEDSKWNLWRNEHFLALTSLPDMLGKFVQPKRQSAESKAGGVSFGEENTADEALYQGGDHQQNQLLRGCCKLTFREAFTLHEKEKELDGMVYEMQTLLRKPSSPATAKEDRS